MDPVILAALVASLGIILYLVFTSFTSKKDESQAERQEQNAQANERAPREGRRQGRFSRLRNRNEREEIQETYEEENGEDFEESKKIGKKKALKLQLKEEKRQQRMAEEDAREQRKQQQEKEDEERKKIEQQREDEERKREEEEEILRREREKKEEEEYQKMKQEFEVESSGTIADERAAFESQIGKFIDFIQERKVVQMEDVAAEFDMKTMETKELIEKLESEGKLSGLIDDRGKFICVTPDEMKRVANFINRRGRVSIDDIARESNKLINLNP